MGYSPSNILTPPEGQTIEFENGNTRLGTKVNTRNVLIDGLGIGDVGNVVLRDRQTMAADGMVTVLIPIEKATGEMVGDIELVSRGFVYMKESEELIGEAKEVVRKTITDHFHSGNDFRHLKRIVTDELEKFLFSSTHRRPLILPVIVEI
jgi:ribonuclease J